MQKILAVRLITLFLSNFLLYAQLPNRNEIIFALQRATDNSSEPTERLFYNNTALSLLQNSTNNTDNRNKLVSVAETFRQLNQWNELRATAKILIDNSLSASSNLSLIDGYKYMGYYHMYQSENDSAMYYFLRAKKIILKNGIRHRLSDCYSDIGLIYYFNCDYFEAQAAYIRSLKEAKHSIDKNRNEYYALRHLGIINTALNDYDKAIEYLNSALLLTPRLKSKFNYKEFCLFEIGLNYFKLGENKKAITYYQQVLQTLKSPNPCPDLYAILLSNLGNAKLQSGNYVEALYFYNLSSSVRDKFHVDQGKNFNLLYLSEYYQAIGQARKSLEFAKKALSTSRSFKAPRDILECLKQLIDIDEANRRTYFLEYSRISDSLQLAERRNRNKFARIAFETDELVVEKDKAIKQKWIIAGILGALLLLALLLFIIKMQSARQKRLLLMQEQQKADEAIYQLINDQQLKVDEGRQAEKKRIARELHDGIMNKLASTRLNLFILTKNPTPESIDKCVEFIKNIQDIEKEVRQVAHDLNQELFSENKGFALLLDTLFEEYRNLGNTRLFTEIDPAFNWEMTESVLRMNIYRILQEALQNSYKYANAKNIFVTLTREEDSVRIIVHDDGTGFDTNKVKKGLGLSSIAERANALKGFFKIISGVREGTILNILLPLKVS